MKLPWSKPDLKSGESWIALAGLPDASWGRTDPATLVRDGYAGNAIVYRCARMIAEAAASITLQCDHEAAQSLLEVPSPDQSGQDLLEQLYIDLQVTGNAWAEAVIRSSWETGGRTRWRRVDCRIFWRPTAKPWPCRPGRPQD
nr:phage portal protein [Hyphomonas sp. Mor2]